MNYNKIIEYFESDEKITELLKVLKENYFDIIDDYAQQIMQEIITTSDELKKAKSVLTGIVASLNPIYSKALTLKKQKEYRFYVIKKETCEANGIKFVDGATTTESKDSVRLYRDVRDIICGYLKSAEALIYDCKDRIEQNKKEYNNTEK